MSTALGLAGLAGAAAAILTGATRELVGESLDLRRFARFVDEPRRLDFTAGVTLTDIGLTASPDLFTADRGVLMVLSDRCVTCHAILERLGVSAHPGLVALIGARTRPEAERWLARIGLELNEQIVFDEFGLLAVQLGVMTSPAAIEVRRGQIVAAWTVPSPRRFDQWVSWLDSTTSDL